MWGCFPLPRAWDSRIPVPGLGLSWRVRAKNHRLKARPLGCWPNLPNDSAGMLTCTENAGLRGQGCSQPQPEPLHLTLTAHRKWKAYTAGQPRPRQLVMLVIGAQIYPVVGGGWRLPHTALRGNLVKSLLPGRLCLAAAPGRRAPGCCLLVPLNPNLSS